MWAPGHGTICYRPSATMLSSFLRAALALAALAGIQEPAPSLADAVLYGRSSVVQSLVAGGANVNERDATGMTPLMVAAAAGHTAIARTLIAAGAEVGAAAPDGTTALMSAASANRGE